MVKKTYNFVFLHKTIKMMQENLVWNEFYIHAYDASEADLELIWGWYTDFGDTWFGRPNSRKAEKEQRFA